MRFLPNWNVPDQIPPDPNPKDPNSPDMFAEPSILNDQEHNSSVNDSTGTFNERK